MSDIDLAPLKEILQPFIALRRSGLLPALHAAQKQYGWLSEPVAAEVAKALRVPLADVHGVIEFYTLFYNKPVGKRIMRVCTDAACALKGADGILKQLCAHYEVEPGPAGGHGQTTRDGTRTIEASPCLGLCEQAPAALVNEEAETNIRADLHQYEIGRPRSLVYGTTRLLTANCGNGTTLLEKYGEYTALNKAKRMRPEAVIAEIKAAGLVGRGGAAFPTGVKWEGAAKAEADQKYVICNADESEPGTFKDRVLLLDDPHRTLEGMCIAAYAVGATKGYIYLRGEYPYILPALENALNEARDAGYLGAYFDIEIRLGAGAYICGEETALFESIEGKRGFPRIKPPFPTTHGVFGKPTVINNVETLCNVPLILSMGASGYRQIGTEKSPGPKLFCLSGDVARPGLYEVPFGVTLRELLEMAGKTDSSTDIETDKRMEADLSADFVPPYGGKSDSRTKTDSVADKRMGKRILEPDSGWIGRMQAVLFGGAAGAFATSAHLNVKLTFEDLRAAGLPLGSGVVMVFDETRDMRQVLKGLGHFFAHESCGKCYPCQMGTQRQKEILNRIAAGRIIEGDIRRLQDVGWTMTDASLCGLGQTAASAVLSAMKLWPWLFLPPMAGTEAVAAEVVSDETIVKGKIIAARIMARAEKEVVSTKKEESAALSWSKGGKKVAARGKKKVESGMAGAKTDESAALSLSKGRKKAEKRVGKKKTKVKQASVKSAPNKAKSTKSKLASKTAKPKAKSVKKPVVAKKVTKPKSKKPVAKKSVRKAKTKKK